MRRSAGSWLTYRVVVVPIPGTCGPHPSPSALGRVIGPRPSRSAVESLLGMPRRRAAELLVAASKHAAFLLPLPMLLNDPRIRVEVVPDNRRANACLIEARYDGVLETRVARRKCVSHTRSMRTASQHERYHDDHGPHRVGSCFFNASHAALCGPRATACAPPPARARSASGAPSPACWKQRFVFFFWVGSGTLAGPSLATFSPT